MQNACDNWAGSLQIAIPPVRNERIARRVFIVRVNELNPYFSFALTINVWKAIRDYAHCGGVQVQ